MLTFHLLADDGQEKTFGLKEQYLWRGAEVALQAAILLILRDYTRRSVISTNHVMQKVRQLLAECDACDQELVRLIREAALLLGLIPVFDPHLTDASQAYQPAGNSARIYENGLDARSAGHVVKRS